ncbi:uncharacterized protein LOC116664609 [Camelus ferus]|uniref:Uncharacterized protein LOC116664609 n=1 Tax=Camelus ferus TaxID=419612 RepID=A0A8B8TAB6_CAMFR|nr:uncharacterized protein LOC116664609 [Camelus ferus]
MPVHVFKEWSGLRRTRPPHPKHPTWGPLTLRGGPELWKSRKTSQGEVSRFRGSWVERQADGGPGLLSWKGSAPVTGHRPGGLARAQPNPEPLPGQDLSRRTPRPINPRASFPLRLAEAPCKSGGAHSPHLSCWPVGSCTPYPRRFRRIFCVAPGLTAPGSHADGVETTLRRNNDQSHWGLRTGSFRRSANHELPIYPFPPSSPLSLILKNKKTSTRMVLRKAGIMVPRCQLSTWIGCHGRQETSPAAERLPGNRKQRLGSVICPRPQHQ